MSSLGRATQLVQQNVPLTARFTTACAPAFILVVPACEISITIYIPTVSLSGPLEGCQPLIPASHAPLCYPLKQVEKTMEPYLYPTSRASRRLSERRGIPELQSLEPSMMLQYSEPDWNTRRSNDSSTPSIFSLDAVDTPVLSAPATPTDTSPLRTLGVLLESSSISFIGSSIQEEDKEKQVEEKEEEDDCNSEFIGCASLRAETRTGEPKVNGLGLMVDELERRQLQFPRKLEIVSSPGSQNEFGQACYERCQCFSNLLPFSMPPTPPTLTVEQRFGYSTDGLLVYSRQTSQDLINNDAFSAGPPSLPQSPTSESANIFGKGRTALILNKVVPAKLRASIKRRLSNPNPMANQPPPISPVATLPAIADPSTPPEEIDCNHFFEVCTPHGNSMPIAPGQEFATVSPEAILPPLNFRPSETSAHVTSPYQSQSRSIGTYPVGYGSPPEILHVPASSHIVSPLISSLSQTPLSTPATRFSMRNTHKKIASIDPGTPVAPKKMSLPITTITADSLAALIDEMNIDLAAYDATRSRMIESGWSSPQEIKNVELQREDKQITWQARIAECKRILEGIRPSEANHWAVPNIGSTKSIGSSIGIMSKSQHNSPGLESFSKVDLYDYHSTCDRAISQ